MRQQTMFRPDAPASPYPGEPAVWVKRLAVLRWRDGVAEPVRDISFRLGLNVVMVDEGGGVEDAGVGHNVGKTLLVRLVRYCLGDPQFAPPDTRARVRDLLPDAWAVGVVSVRGRAWSVARPLGHGRHGWCVPGEDWRPLFHDPSSRRPFADLEAELQRLAPPGLASVQVANPRRVPGWGDLLGWLARDQGRRYTHHNEWRDTDADSGVASLPAGDANLITRVTMGLFDAEESRLTERLERLRAETRDLEEEAGRFRLASELLRAGLVAAAPVSGDLPDGPLFAEAIRGQVRQRREGQERLLADLDARKRLDAAERALAEASARAERTAGRLEELERLRSLARRQLEAVSAEPDGGRAWMACGAAGCLHLAPRPDAQPDPLRQQRVRDHAAEADRLAAEIASLRADHARQGEEARDAARRLGEARVEYDRATADVRRSVARYEAAEEEIARYEAVQSKLAAAEARLESAPARERELEQQRAGRARGRDRLMAELNAVFGEVTGALLGRPSGELVLNLRDGLAPRTDASSGEAFGTAGKVIGFDLACVLAAMLGRGMHPRFLIHDSPREADMHRSIYEAIFRVAIGLESRFPGKPPAFQYIITTTTRPPAEACCEPYVRETLRATPPSGRLLRVEF